MKQNLLIFTNANIRYHNSAEFIEELEWSFQ